MMVRRLPGIIIGLLFAQSLSAQEIRFSQYQATPVYVNPAMAGAIANPTIRLNSRFQQFGPVAYRTGYASVTLPLYLSENEERVSGGVSAGFLGDIAGQSSEFRTNLAQLAAAYNLHFNRFGTQFLSLGIQTEYRQTSINYSGLTWPSQLRYNGFTGTDLPSAAYEDRLGVLGIQAGIMWMYDPARNPLDAGPPVRLYAGFSVNHLNEPGFSLTTTTDNTLSRVYQAQAGAEFVLGPRLLLSPDMLAAWQTQLFTYQVGAAFTYQTQYSTPSDPVPADLRLIAGTWYREESALVFLVGMGGARWQAAVSYDANVGQNRRGITNQYALEVSLKYQWATKRTPESQSTPLF